MQYKKRILFVILFIISLLVGAKWAKGQTVSVVTSGNITTTTTTTTTPTNTVVTPNVPNYGDQTVVTTNNVQTSIVTTETNKNTGNLLSNNNFCTGGWTGTQITGGTSDLGCSYLTGKGSTYAEKSLTLTNNGISITEQNLGFTQSASASTGFYWYHPQSLIMSHSVTNLDTGETITQNRTLTKGVGSDPNYMTVKSLDNIIIGSNSSSQGYTSKLRFDFSDSGSGTWRGADVTNPNLSITYTGYSSSITNSTTSVTTIIPCSSLGTCYVPEPIILPTTITNTNTNTTIAPELQTNNLTSTNTNTTTNLLPPPPSFDTNTTSSTTLTKSTTDTQNTNLQQSMMTTTTTTEGPTQTKETSNVTSSPTPQESTTSSTSTSTQTQPSSETTKTTSTEPASSTNTKAEGSPTQTNTKENVADTKVSTNEKGSTNVSVNVKTQIEKVEKELKSIGDKTKAIQEIKIEALRTLQPNLDVYSNKAFYEPRQMNGVPNPDFFNQINITQQQIYKDVSLSAYTSKDPIAVKQRFQMELEEEMNKLILEIEMLRKG